MASVAGIFEENGVKDPAACSAPPFQAVIPPYSLLPGGQLSLIHKRKLDMDMDMEMEMEMAPASTRICNRSSIQLDDESDDEVDQWPYSPSVAISERLSTLQHLLPQGLELEEEEVLRVALEYVKELERKIQMYQGPSDGRSKLEQSMSDSSLKRKGLCIVPLSTLAKAL